MGSEKFSSPVCAIISLDVSEEELNNTSPSDQDYIFRISSPFVTVETEDNYVVLCADASYENALRREAAWLWVRLEGVYGKGCAAISYARL